MIEYGVYHGTGDTVTRNEMTLAINNMVSTILGQIGQDNPSVPVTGYVTNEQMTQAIATLNNSLTKLIIEKEVSEPDDTMKRLEFEQRLQSFYETMVELFREQEESVPEEGSNYVTNDDMVHHVQSVAETLQTQFLDLIGGVNYLLDLLHGEEF